MCVAEVHRGWPGRGGAGSKQGKFRLCKVSGKLLNGLSLRN